MRGFSALVAGRHSRGGRAKRRGIHRENRVGFETEGRGSWQRESAGRKNATGVHHMKSSYIQ
jgi:hypothetical protein